MPVVKRDTLESRDDVIGSIRERGLLERVYREPSMLDATVADVMEAPLPMVDEADTVESVMPSLSADWQAVLVCSGSAPAGVLTRSDVLDFLVQPS
jgi:cystathionine beta-synthase